MLAAKVAGAVHDWPSLLPQLRMEYMQRRHSVTGYSPNELTYAHRLRLPPPVRLPDVAPRVASAEFANPEQQYIHERDERTESMCARVYDNILNAQERNKQQQLQLLAGRKPGRGRKLHAGDLAYVVTPKPNKKMLWRVRLWLKP